MARYIGRHGTQRVAKAVLMGAVPPIMVKTAANPGGLPIEVFDGFREAYLADRSQFFLDVASGPFFGFNRPGAKVSQGLIQSWWMQGMMSGHKNAYDCIKAFSETDFTEDLKTFDVPTLIIHGDDDQIVPIGASALLSAKLVQGAMLKIYPGGSHGLGDTTADAGQRGPAGVPEELTSGAHDLRTEAALVHDHNRRGEVMPQTSSKRRFEGTGGLKIFMRSWRPARHAARGGGHRAMASTRTAATTGGPAEQFVAQRPGGLRA